MRISKTTLCILSLGKTILNMILNIMTNIMTKLSKMTFSIVALSKIYETRNMATSSIVILSTSIRTMTLSKMTLSITT